MAAARALDGMEEPGMDTEAEAVATKAPACPLNCVEAKEGGEGAPGNLQPAPAQPPGDPAAQASVSNSKDAGGGAGRKLVNLKIIWNKTKHDVKLPLDSTGSELKQKIHSITGLLPAMQKVMYKGLVPEDKTLREIKVTSGAEIMVVGSTINDVLAVNTPKDAAQQDAKAEENKKEPLCRQKQHRKVMVNFIGQPGWLSSLVPPSTQGLIVETGDRVPHWATCMEPASPSACVSASLSLSLL
uniref:Ubiquitin-like domain-containing protein n=1 Tax=Canis lupus familiaris TaxID=9615 RepID=A0A8C0PKW3_CANLF